MKARITRWFRQSVAVERGPVVFSLPVRGKWSKVVNRGSASDWQVVPEDDWNYALDLSARTKDSIRVIEREDRRRVHRIGCLGPLDHEGSKVPNGARSKDRGELPVGPVKTAASAAELTLIPYGAAKLRVTALPQIL